MLQQYGPPPYYPAELCYGRYYRPPGPYHIPPPQPEAPVRLHYDTTSLRLFVTKRLFPSRLHLIKNKSTSLKRTVIVVYNCRWWAWAASRTRRHSTTAHHPAINTHHKGYRTSVSLSHFFHQFIQCFGGKFCSDIMNVYCRVSWMPVPIKRVSKKRPYWARYW